MKRLILPTILLLAAFIIFYRINDLIPFFNDQGWFDLAARNMLITGQIPLVGITSSHIWLHQGAYWTYMLAIPFALSHYNPVSGAILTGIIGLITIYLIYYLGKQMFSESVGTIAAFLYMTSPLAIVSARMEYHTSPISFFTTLLLLCIYKWVKGNRMMVPLIIGLLAILYNFEIATVSLSFACLILLIYGLRYKKSWTNIFSRKIIGLSIAAYIIPMLPMLLYDITHGFPETLKFIAWIGYKAVSATGLYHLHNNPPTNWGEFFHFLFVQNRNLLFLYNGYIALILLFIAIIILLIKIKGTNYALLFLFLSIPLVLVLVGGVTSEAYLPVLFPTVLLSLATFFDWGINRSRIFKIAAIIILISIGSFNINGLLKTEYLTSPTLVRHGEGYVSLQAIESQTKAILNTQGKHYSFKDLKTYKNLTDNYQFIALIMRQ